MKKELLDLTASEIAEADQSLIDKGLLKRVIDEHGNISIKLTELGLVVVSHMSSDPKMRS